MPLRNIVIALALAIAAAIGRNGGATIQERSVTGLLCFVILILFLALIHWDEKREKKRSSRFGWLFSLALLAVYVMVLVGSNSFQLPTPHAAQSIAPTLIPISSNLSTPSKTPMPSREYPVLKQGDSGPAVERIQEALVVVGFLSSGDIDGSYGRKTQSAILAYQKEYLYDQDPYATSRTQDVLIRHAVSMQNMSGMTDFEKEFWVRKEQSEAVRAKNNAQKVYIAPYSGQRYHESLDCEGLENALSLERISLDEAKQQGKTKCRYCYGF